MDSAHSNKTMRLISEHNWRNKRDAAGEAVCGADIKPLEEKPTLTVLH